MQEYDERERELNLKCFCAVKAYGLKLMILFLIDLSIYYFNMQNFAPKIVNTS